MDNDDLIPHIIQIAGQKYPVRLTEKEKDLAKEIEREINKKITDFQVKYMVNSKQDVLAMLLLTYAFDSKNEQNSQVMSIANNRIERLLQTFESLEEE